MIRPNGNNIKQLDEYCRLHNCSILLNRNALKGIVINEEYYVGQNERIN